MSARGLGMVGRRADGFTGSGRGGAGDSRGKLAWYVDPS